MSEKNQTPKNVSVETIDFLGLSKLPTATLSFRLNIVDAERLLNGESLIISIKGRSFKIQLQPDGGDS